MNRADRDRMRVFAYGSNMSTPRLRERAPSAIAVSIGYVSGRTLKWNKVSVDGSGKCDMAPALGPGQVWGVVFALDGAEKPALDKAEGLGKGYREEVVQVHTSGGVVEANAYVATRTENGLRPYHGYKQYVLDGAREHGLPDAYIRMLEATESVPEPDRPLR